MDILEVLRRNLDDRQFDAATDSAREVLCLACAGSGKSRTLAYRIARLIAEGEPPESIVAFTFTKKAAESIKLNVTKALAAAGMSPNIIGRIGIGTIHSFCQSKLCEIDPRFRQYEVLDANRFKLYLISRFWSLGMKQLMKEKGARKFATVDETAHAWEILNHEMIDVGQVAKLDPLLGTTLNSVRERLERDQYIDYSLMIRYVVEALKRKDESALKVVADIRHLMVDEYQDVNTAEEALISELHAVRPDSTLFVVGDDDQAIYGWRGADVSNIQEFQDRHPDCSRKELSINYRSVGAIVAAADGFAVNALGPSRYLKHPSAAASPSPRDFRVVRFEDRADEAVWAADRIASLMGTEYVEKNGTVRGLTQGDFAVLMRSTRTPENDGGPRSSSFTEELTRRRILYTIESGGTIFSRAEVMTVRDTFSLLETGMPPRDVAKAFFDERVVPTFSGAHFDDFVRVLTEWGRKIHSADAGARVRLYPQQLYYDLLEAFGVGDNPPDESVMRDLGVFSTILKDVETVYPSMDGAGRFREMLSFLTSVENYGYDRSTDDVVRRPDLVTISTVHKMKGLEFPVVFIVDVEQGRFPKRESSYRGWMPPELIARSLRRGRYATNESEEARLFYTAMTRAERFLYISGSKMMPEGKKSWKPSSFLPWVVNEEISDDPEGMPEGLASATPARRTEEVVVPTTFTDICAYLRCPKEYQFRKSFGFNPPINEMFGYGLTVHTGITKIHATFPDGAPAPEAAADVATENFHLKHVFQSNDPVNRPGAWERAKDSVGDIAKTYVESYADDFGRRRVVEQAFEAPLENAVISGSIDLLLKFDATDERILDAVVVDFKTMEGGEIPEENRRLQWWEMALQVQLYAMAAKEILGEQAATGKVHLLKDNRRVEIPVHDGALKAAKTNVEWAVKRIIAGDFPMRAQGKKCEKCDFAAICPAVAEEFGTADVPPAIFVPSKEGCVTAACFSEFDGKGRQAS